jgi:hypothetical protein
MQSETLVVQGEAIPTAVVPVLVEATATAAVVLAVAATIAASSSSSNADVKSASSSSVNGDGDRVAIKANQEHPSWQTVHYQTTNTWPKSMPKSKKETCRRKHMWGVEIRELPPDHPLGKLGGQHGLYATKVFEPFDIIGEYVGEVVDDQTSGHYVACLEDKALELSMGLNAEWCGNEARYGASHSLSLSGLSFLLCLSPFSLRFSSLPLLLFSLFFL